MYVHSRYTVRVKLYCSHERDPKPRRNPSPTRCSLSERGMISNSRDTSVQREHAHVQAGNSYARVWQDKEMLFDVHRSALILRCGEANIDSINSVEDTKGNSGQRGSLTISNLRVLWASHKSRRTNLSIGLNTVVSINIQKAKSKLCGQTQVFAISA